MMELVYERQTGLLIEKWASGKDHGTQALSVIDGLEPTWPLYHWPTRFQEG
jgi:hypothetical protein